MLIVSKFKDYYDYLQGVWGVDELKVLDRTKFLITPEYLIENDIVSIYIGDYLIQGIVKDGKWIFGEDIKPYDKEANTVMYFLNKKGSTETHYCVLTSGYSYMKYEWVLKNPQKLNENKSPNTKLNKPILIAKGVDDYDENPILKDYNIQKILPAETIWLILSDWLGKEKVISNNQTDKEKVIAAGFDTKISFRHRK